MKICRGYCALMLSLSLYGCGAAPSGTTAATDSAVALSNYSGARSGTLATDEEAAASPTIYINGVPLNEIAATIALRTIDLAAPAPPTANAAQSHMAAAARPTLENNGIVMAKALPSSLAFKNVTSVPKGMTTPAF